MQIKQNVAQLLGLGLLLSSLFANAQEIASDDHAYKIQAGDVIEIMVWKEEGLQQEVLVRPDGGISFPLAGELMAKGKSTDQLRAELEEKLGSFFSEPVVFVSAKQLFGNKVFVIGKVNQPGEFILNSPLDVMQALSKAGGMTPFSAVNDIIILRRNAEGKQQAIEFKYGDIEDGDDLEQNIILQAGDVVVVP